MKDYCKSCKHDNDIGYCDKCFYNHLLEERGIPPTEYEAKQTNADRIRAMSDEELAVWYCRFRECTKCPHAKGCRVVGEGILDWLRQEVMPNDS